MTEAEIIELFAPRRALPGHVLAGIGDDCAILAPPGGPLLLTTDVQVEGRHFRREWTTPRGLGRKALAVNLSDLAAMGGTPRGYLLVLGVPRGTEMDLLREIRGGLAEWEEEAGCPLVGGHTFLCPGGLFFGITALGEAPPGGALLRSGARPGDLLAVSGTLGGAASALRALLAGGAPPAETLARWTDPVPRLALGALLARSGATACMDLSDGLSSDLHRLALASGTGALVRSTALPRHPSAQSEDNVLHGGEDYELLFTIPAGLFAALAAASPVPLTVIGEMTPPGTGVTLESADGLRAPLPPAGHDHLRDPA